MIWKIVKSIIWLTFPHIFNACFAGENKTFTVIEKFTDYWTERSIPVFTGKDFHVIMLWNLKVHSVLKRITTKSQ